MLTARNVTSHAIGQKSAQSLYHAFQLAERLGLPLETHVTINFAATACDGCMAVPIFAKLRRDLFGKWAMRGAPAFHQTGVYAFENVRDGIPFQTIEPGGDHNVHVHWALHVPAHRKREFEERLPIWVAALTGGIKDAAKVICITTRPRIVLRRYVLKGCNNKWAPVYGATAQPQGIIVGGLRANTSANLRKSKRIAFDRENKIVRRTPQRPHSQPSAA